MKCEVCSEKMIKKYRGNLFKIHHICISCYKKDRYRLSDIKRKMCDLLFIENKKSREIAEILKKAESHIQLVKSCMLQRMHRLKIDRKNNCGGLKCHL